MVRWAAARVVCQGVDARMRGCLIRRLLYSVTDEPSTARLRLSPARND